MISGIVFFGMFVGVPLLIAYVAYSNKQARAFTQAYMLSHGYTPVPNPTPELFRPIEAIYCRAPREKRKIRNAFLRSLPEGQLMFFDLVDASSSDEDTDENIVAITSPTLQLPWFKILTNTGPGSWDSFGTWAASTMGTPRLHYPEHPLFEQNCRVFSGQEAEMRRLLNADFLNWLASQDRAYIIMGCGNTFTLQAAIGFQRGPSLSMKEGFDRQIRDAQHLLSWLR